MRFGKLRKISAHPYFPIILLIVCNLLLGLVIGNDYGESWDEQNGYVHAEGTLDAYEKLFKGEDLKPKNFGPFTRRYYGPFSYVAGNLLVDAMGDFPPGWMAVDRWHLTYFLWFQLAVFSFYAICLRLLQERWAAFGTALLFPSKGRYAERLRAHRGKASRAARESRNYRFLGRRYVMPVGSLTRKVIFISQRRLLWKSFQMNSKGTRAWPASWALKEAS